MSLYLPTHAMEILGPIKHGIIEGDHMDTKMNVVLRLDNLE